MLEPKSNVTASGIGVHDVITVLFKHKWKIILCSVVGLAASAGIYFTFAPLYESEAKVLVRYVVERSAVDPLETANGTKLGDSVISSEIDILTSADLSLKIAEDIGVERLLRGAKGPKTKIAAAQMIGAGLSVSSRHNVLVIGYRNQDPQLATLVLDKLVAEYFIKHLDTHRPPGAFDIVTKQSDEIRGRLLQTEDDLKRTMAKVGILSRADSITVLTGEMAKSRDELRAVEAELAEQEARVKQMEKTVGGTLTKRSNAAHQPEPERLQTNSMEVQKYNALLVRLAQLRQFELEMMAKYTPENQLVRLNRSEIVELDGQRRNLEAAFPGIAAVVPTKDAKQQGHGVDLDDEVTRLVGLVAKVDTLRTRGKIVQEQYSKFAESAPEIAGLERKKELEETNLKYIGASLEKARIDQSLDPSKMPNLSIVQKPSVAAIATSAREKLAARFAGGGIALGLGLAFLLELIMDRSVKRPLEIETRLHIPLMLTIPQITRKSPRRLRQAKGDRELQPSVQSGIRGESSPWEPGHFIRPFSEGIRDRLVLFFKINGMTHKPKMVAVTGYSGGEGTSTIAAGLASVLSEMGDGKVLLVDMNGGEAEVHPFFDGKPVRSIFDVLHGGGSYEEDGENLIVARASSIGQGATTMIPKKFYNLVPHFKASDFDYIVFDMPPLDKSSATLAMAGSMDKVLVVIEAEKSNGDLVKRACSELVAAKAHVSGILNKTRSYAPKWLQG